MSITSSFYAENADELAKQYNSLAATKVHQVWRKYWPSVGDNVLDIGAGSGRDSLWFTRLGCHVVACEPCKELLVLGSAHTGKEVVWLDDRLPDLRQLSKLNTKFDVILVSAVWMHIPSNLRKKALNALVNHLKNSGVIVISLRHGLFNDGRESYSVSVEELTEQASDFNLALVDVFNGEDIQHRQGVRWQTVVLRNNPSVDREGRHGS